MSAKIIAGDQEMEEVGVKRPIFKEESKEEQLILKTSFKEARKRQCPRVDIVLYP